MYLERHDFEQMVEARLTRVAAGAVVALVAALLVFAVVTGSG